MYNPNTNNRVTVGIDNAPVGQVQFELQPIVRTNSMIPRGYELLYRGPRTVSWVDVDRAALSYLRDNDGGHMPLFINLSNESLLAIPATEFAEAAAGRKVVFEISESHTDQEPFAKIAAKVNDLIELGLQVAIDDFGAGRDGLQRIYTIKRVSVIKIDRLFACQAMSRSDAANVLRLLVAHWRASGIQVVIEGVENAAILDFAKEMGADLAQGWLVDSMVAERALQAA